MTTYSSQPDATAGIDVVLYQPAPTTNFGTLDTIRVRDADQTSVIKFDLSSIPTDATCDDATLDLWFAVNSPGTATLSVYAILAANSAWTETGATWNTRDGTNAWAGSNGCNTSGTDHNATAMGTGSITSQTAGTLLSITLDPASVEALFAVANYGLVLKSSNEFVDHQFHSSDSSSSTLRPKLTINYTEAGGDPAPSVSDSSTVTDTPTLFTDQLHRSVSDSATLADTPTLSVESIAGPTLAVSVSDTAITYEGVRVYLDVPQFARPTSDVTSTNWTSSSGTDEWAMLDEVTASDADFATTGTQGAGLEVALSALIDPASSAGHIVRFRARSSGSSGPERQTVLLLQGGTTIATLISSGALVRTTWTQSNITLSGAQADAITNYSDLRLRFTADTLGGGEAYQVSWAEMEVPPVATPMHALIYAQDGTSVSDTPTAARIGDDNTKTVSVTDSATVADSASVVLAEPLSTEWSGYRKIFEPGASNEWDYIFWGGAGGKPVKVGSTYYFYYAGSDSGDEINGDSNRAIGLATSDNFLTWTKHASNPFITYTTTAGVETEEGATNPVVLVDGGTWHMWYAASRYNGTPGQVDVDIRYRTSSDGITWTGDALVYSVATEEHKPVGVLKIGSTYYLYGIGNLTGGRGPLWVMSGTDPTVLSSKTEVLAGTWFSASFNDLNSDVVSVALYETDYELQWRRIERATPTVISAQIGSTLAREAGYAAPSYLFRDGTLWREIGLQTSGPDYYAYRHSPAALATHDNAASDSSSVSDAPTVAVTLAGINVSDSVSTGDAPSVALDLYNLTVSDTATVADTPTTAAALAGVNVTDSVTVVDTPTVTPGEVGQTEISVSDSAAVSDTPTVALLLAGINVTDSVSVSDAPALSSILPGIAVTDSASVTDTPALSVTLAGIDVADSATVTDAPALAATLGDVSVADSTTLSDVPTVQAVEAGQTIVNVADSAAVTDAPSLAATLAGINVADGVAVVDTPTLTRVDAGQTVIAVSDSTTVQDTPEIAVVMGTVTLTETITVSENVTVTLVAQDVANVTVSETVTLTESITVTAQLGGVTVSETVTLSESITHALSMTVSVSDVASALDVPSLAAILGDLAVSDSVTVDDAAWLLIDPLLLSVLDNVTVGDSPLLTPDYFAIYAADNVVVSDSVWLFIGLISTPVSRTLVIPFEPRVVLVARENRTLAVPSEQRILAVHEDD